MENRYILFGDPPSYDAAVTEVTGRITAERDDPSVELLAAAAGIETRHGEIYRVIYVNDGYELAELDHSLRSLGFINLQPDHEESRDGLRCRFRPSVGM